MQWQTNRMMAFVGVALVLTLAVALDRPAPALAGNVLAQATFSQDCETGQPSLTGRLGALSIRTLGGQEEVGVAQAPGDTTLLGPHTVSGVACDGEVYAEWRNGSGSDVTVNVDVKNTGKCNVVIQSGQIRDITIRPSGVGGGKILVRDGGFVAVRCAKTEDKKCEFTVVIKQ